MKICIASDTGSGYDEQYIVADAIHKYHEHHDLKAVLLLGDNIYEDGVESVDDEQFITKFELPYQQIDLPFFLLLGNHDYANLADPSAFEDYAIHQINRHNVSKKWNMPDRYYTVKFGNCEFFMLDTNLENMTNDEIILQLKYMRRKLKRSKKKFKFICGHHTWRSSGEHSTTTQFDTFMKHLVLNTNIKAYFCGHDHCKNHIQIPYPSKKPKKSTKRKTQRKNKRVINLFIIGTGGKSMDSSYLDKSRIKNPDKLLYQDANLGFIILDITSTKVKVEIYSCTDKSMELNYEYFI